LSENWKFNYEGWKLTGIKIMKRQIIILVMLLTTPASYSQNAKKSESVNLNGTNIYYEVYGNGEPLFLLHGFTRSSMSWYPYISAFENEYEVYLVDLKGHGKSGHFEEKISVKSAAADVDELIKYLGLEQIHAIGYSYGGDILFQLTLLRPGLIKSMVVVGAYGTWDAKDFPEFAEFLSMKNIENLPWMRKQQTGEDQIKKILEQVPHYSVRLNEDELKSISAKTLLVIGDNDNSVNWNDILKTKKLLPDASLWVVPNMGHGAHRDQNKGKFIQISKEFFNQHTFSEPGQALENRNIAGSTGKPYTLGIWKVKPEKEKDFINEWTAFATWTGSNISGSGKAHLLQDKENPLRFISFGSWDSEESISKWRNYNEFKTFVEKVKELCDEFQPNTLNEVSSSE
jgi:pimeloyl-ACP methyl ester carboxylesterase/heme-degrading monooxygenase HmoA